MFAIVVVLAILLGLFWVGGKLWGKKVDMDTTNAKAKAKDNEYTETTMEFLSNVCDWEWQTSSLRA